MPGEDPENNAFTFLCSFAKRAEKKFRLFLFRNAMAKGKAHSAESSGAKASRERALHEFEKQFERDHPEMLVNLRDNGQEPLLIGPFLKGEQFRRFPRSEFLNAL